MKAALPKFARVFAGAALFAVGLNVASAAPLSLINGWTDTPFSTNKPQAIISAGIVRFKGAISTTGTNTFPFVLPSNMWPETDVFVPVDLCGATNGRLHIAPSGTVDVEVETTFSNAQCLTSLDGASYAPNASLFTGLALLNGWKNAPSSTSAAAVRVIDNIVYLKGAIAASETNAVPFVLPIGFRPPKTAYVAVDMCNATKGLLNIANTGVVSVQVLSDFSNAECFVSLDNAKFALNATDFISLALKNGWHAFSTTTATPQVRNINGVVTFRGAMATSGTNAEPFTLAVAYRPTKNVYLLVDMCSATRGRLFITPKGVVTVQAETSFSAAKCLTSLDGASFTQ